VARCVDSVHKCVGKGCSKKTRRLGHGRCLMHATEPLQHKNMGWKQKRQKRGKWDQQKPTQLHMERPRPAAGCQGPLLLRGCQVHTDCWAGGGAGPLAPVPAKKCSVDRLPQSGTSPDTPRPPPPSPTPTFPLSCSTVRTLGCSSNRPSTCRSHRAPTAASPRTSFSRPPRLSRRLLRRRRTAACARRR
jgi:hypothetical protein